MDEQLPISAIEHFAYCRRQALLIHGDAQWQPSADTAQGEADHSAIDRGTRGTTREGRVAWFSLPLWHDGLGLYGVADTVEIMNGAPCPVEQKPSLSRWANAPAAQQLAAQAMCLERMWDTHVPYGVLFTRKDRRRHEIAIDSDLREATVHTIDALRSALADPVLPDPVWDRRCDRCSLRDACKGAWASKVTDPFLPAEEGSW